MHKNATKCNKTQRKWCINKHGASKIIDMFETISGWWCGGFGERKRVFVKNNMARDYNFICSKVKTVITTMI
jgi:hypothetical protein